MEKSSHLQGLLKLSGSYELSLPTNEGKYIHPSFLEEKECITDSRREKIIAIVNFHWMPTALQVLFCPN